MADPLTLTLSPGEREQPERGLAFLPLPEIEHGPGFLPLPEGEGRGEGEKINTTQR